MRLETFGLKNFRVFKGLEEFQLSPITLLTGTNSSGKSSVFKALLLLANSFYENKLTKLDFNKNAHSHNLVDFDLTLNRENLNELMSFKLHLGNKEIELEYKEGELNSFKVADTFSNRVLIRQLYSFEFHCGWFDKELPLWHDSFSFITDIEKTDFIEEGIHNIELVSTIWVNVSEIISNNKGLFTVDENKFWDKTSELNDKEKEELIAIVHSLIVVHLEQRLLSGRKPQDKFLKLTPNDIYRIFKVSPQDKSGYFLEQDASLYDLLFKMTDFFVANQKDIVNRKGINEIKVDNQWKVLKNHLSNIPIREIISSGFITDIEKKLNELFNELETSLSYTFDFKYLPANKGGAQRVYLHQDNSPLSQALYDYHNLKKEETSKEYIDQRDSFISRSIRRILGDKYEVHLKNSSNGFTEVLFGLKGSVKKHSIPITDLGHGASQALPLIISIASFPLNKSYVDHPSITNIKRPDPYEKIFIIEEPETNLHPKLQSQLADILIDAQETFRLKFLIETHSEYLIRKLQYLTLTKQLSPDGTSIYYLYPVDEVPNQSNQVEKINILPNGKLDNEFGEGFFDEATRLLLMALDLGHSNSSVDDFTK